MLCSLIPDPELGACLGTLSVAALLSWLLTPLVARLAWRLGCVDQPGPRRVHQYPTPRLGGLAVLCGLLLACLAAELSWELWPLLGIAALVAGLGAIDDRRPLSPLTKLSGQGLAGLLLHLSGLGLQHLQLPGLPALELGALALPATICWVVVCTNAINLIDGADGLGSGVVLIAASGLMLCCLGLGKAELALICGATAGAAGGFLFHNQAPARIFLGDSGSLLLGFLLAAVASAGAHEAQGALLLPAAALALGVPFTDTLQCFGRRFLRALRRGGPGALYRALRATAVADKRHIHHRLLLRGYSHRQVAGLMCLVTTVCSLCSLAILPDGGLHWSAALATAGAGALVLLRLASVGRNSLAMARALRRLRQDQRPHPGTKDFAPQGMGKELARGATQSTKQLEHSEA